MQQTEAFGFNISVPDIDQAVTFYEPLIAHDALSPGVFAGIKYTSLMKSGETALTIFQASPDSPLQGIFPTIKVKSVAGYVEDFKSQGGNIVLPPSICPCTNAAFALVADKDGNQFICKEARTK